jgi:hypothetical protein
MVHDTGIAVRNNVDLQLELRCDRSAIKKKVPCSSSSSSSASVTVHQQRHLLHF